MTLVAHTYLDALFPNEEVEMWLRVIATALAAGMLSIGCLGADTVTLSESSDPSFEDIRARLPITIRPGPSAFSGFASVGGAGPCNTTSCSPDLFADAVYFGCARTPLSTRAAGTCQNRIARAEAFLCAAHRLLEVVDYPGGREVLLSDADPAFFSGMTGTVVVPPQDAESNSELSRIAARYASSALGVCSDALDTATSTCSNSVLDSSAGTGALASITIAEEFAEFYRESVEVLLDASERFEQQGAAVSDAAYAARPDGNAATAALAPFASRTAAAHWLIGGSTTNAASVPTGLPAIAGIAERGFFTRSRLSGEGQRALQLFRTAAVDPALVTGSASITDLLLGAGAVSAENSLRYRVGYMQNRDDVREAPSADVFYQTVGVSSDGFTEAREYLREEIRAFDRSPTAVLPPEPLPVPDTTTQTQNITLFAATRTAPQQLLPSYWAAALRFDPTPARQTYSYFSWSSPPPWEWRPYRIYEGNEYFVAGDAWGNEVDFGPIVVGQGRVFGSRTLASVFDEVFRRSPQIMSQLCPSGTCSTGLGRARDSVARAVAQLNTGGGTGATRYDTAAYLGRARACVYHWSAAYQDLVLDVSSEVNPAELVAVIGRDGLDCAVRGTIEGVPCTATQLTSLTKGLSPWTAMPTASSPDHYRASTLDLQENVSTRPSAGTATIFLVRKRVGAGPGSNPGQFEEFAGWVLPIPGPNPVDGRFTYCVSAAIAPVLERRAANLIQPDPAEPYRPAESCAGLPSDLRVPLENELTDDNNGVESSWRHYLDLAKSAAADADGLGEDLIRTGLEMDLRSESASEDLTRLCGMQINLSQIATGVQGTSSPPAVSATPPDANGNCSPTYYVRNGNRCVLDPVLYAASQAVSSEDMRRLASCIGADVVPWATAGDVPLCIWDDPALPGVCENRGNQPCPIASAACPTTTPPAGSWVQIPASAALRLFQRPDDPRPAPPPDPNSLPCREIARLRTPGSSPADLAVLDASPFLTYDGFGAIASQLSFSPGVGDYLTVKYDGTPIISTGYYGQTLTASSRWPMGSLTSNPVLLEANCPSSFIRPPEFPAGYVGPLFCLHDFWDSSMNQSSGAGRAQRARMNDLLARAVMAARVVSGRGYAGLEFPYVPSTGSYTFATVPSSISWDPLSGAVAFEALAGEFVFDNRGTDGAGAYRKQVSDLGARIQWLQNTGQNACTSTCGTTTNLVERAEWSRVRYDQPETSCLDVFDDGGACAPSGYVRDVPLIIRAAESGLDRPDAAPALTRLWSRRLPDLIRNAGSLSPSIRTSAFESRFGPDITLSSLTNYHSINGCNSGNLEYEQCVEGNGWRRLTVEANRAAFAPNGLTVNDFLNGVELACVAARQGFVAADTSCSEPTGTSGIADAYRYKRYFECRAAALSGDGADSVIANLPRRVVEAIRQDGTGAYGTNAGEFEAQVSEIRAALVELGNIRLANATDLRAMGGRVSLLRNAVNRSQRANKIEQLMTQSRMLDRMVQCATKAAETADIDPASAAGKAASAAITCLNSYAQIAVEGQVAQLRRAQVEADVIDEFTRFDTEAGQFSRNFSERATSMRTQFLRIDAALSRLRAVQAQARRALSRALLLESPGTAAHNAVNTVYRTRYNVLLERYRRSHSRAVRAAFIARRALEQRLGMNLESLEDDVFSDESPRSWVDTLCTLPSINYDQLRGGTPGPTGMRGAQGDSAGLQAPDGYTGTHVGDYVRRLGDLFESYNFVHPFQEGTDTAVISLRDDLARTKIPCWTRSPNLLASSGKLDQPPPSPTAQGWRVTGCAPEAVGGTGIVARRCVSVRSWPDTPSIGVGPGARPTIYNVDFNNAPAATLNTRIEQTVSLPAGRYRVSWFSRPFDYGLDQSDGFVQVLNSAGNAVPLVGPTGEAYAGGDYYFRRWRFFELSSATQVRVAIDNPNLNVLDFQIPLFVGGFMLENVTQTVTDDLDRTLPGSTTLVGVDAEPGPYAETNELGQSYLPVCPDIAGAMFHRQAWERRCVRTCIDGYDGNCPEQYQARRCAWETAFDIDADTLQRTLLAGDSGFAAGNYNYRIDSIAVNFVGTQLRNCTDRGTQGCYGSGNHPYSILHSGPYLVRDARGRSYDAPLFPGRLESARALAAERYITNPISGADQGLIMPYTRTELRGRPLGGTMTLRVWDDPTFEFENLEDVQLVLKYRYWQHQR